MTETTGPTHPLTDPLFVRPREGRMLAGVCAGVAQRWQLDVTLVRVATALLVLVSGVGLLAYLAAWALTPTVDGPAPLDPDSRLARSLSGRGPTMLRRALAVLLVLLVAGALIGALHRLVWWGWGWGWSAGIGVPVGLIALAAAVAILVRSRAARLTAAAFAALVLVLAVVAGAFGGNFGYRSFAVSSPQQLQQAYDYPVGSVRLDLSRLTALAGRHHTAIRVGSGDVTVNAPAGVPVLVRSRVGVGSVTINGHHTSGLDTEQTVLLGNPAAASDELVVNVKVGVGSVTVT